jgi:acyl-CoA synthetase (AMP-forming)/AMP-acid ligase II
MTVRSLLDRCAQLWPEHSAVIEDATQRTHSFAALVRDVAAAGLRLAGLGLAPGDRVALLGDATYAYLLADYGAMYSGFVRVPLDPSLTVDELGNQIADAGAKILLFGVEQAALAASVRAPAVLPIDTVTASGASADRRPGETADTDLASLNYTGGTTGQPKAVMLSQGNLSAAAANIVGARGMGPGDTMVNMRPLWPIAAVIVLAHLAAGGTVVLGGRFEPQRLLSLLEKYRAAATSLVPTHLTRLLKDTDPRSYKLEALRAIDVGGAAIPPETFEAALVAFGPKIGVLYGLTEAPWSCYQPPLDLAAPPEARARRVRAVGRPLAGCEIMIAGDHGAAPPGEAGEVLIRGPHVTQGYWQRPEITRDVLREGWFHSGDIGTLDENGRLAIVGRIKDVIRSGAKTVQPREVEAVLRQHPAVLDAAVIGLPDAEWGEIVAAGVVARPNAAISEAELIDYCRNRLAAHKRPKLVRLLDELPRSHYGKVQGAKLRTELQQGRPASTA